MSKEQDRKDANLMKVVRALRESEYPKLFAMDSYVWARNETWFSGNETAVKELEKIEERGKEEEFCGTPACALGHFASRTDLQRILKVVRDPKNGTASMSMYGSDVPDDWDMDAVNEYFGISHEEHDELFGGEGCGNAKTAKQAAKYIEEFVRERRKKRKQEEFAKTAES